jgi:anti-anti-sigma factor
MGSLPLGQSVAHQVIWSLMVHIATDTSTKPRAVGLFVRGQLDLTAVGAFRESLTRATRASRAVELHLGDVDFIDGCGLSILIDAMTRARGAGHEISIVDASVCVRRLIEITDTADRLAPLPVESAGGRIKTKDNEEMARIASGAVHGRAFRTHNASAGGR